MNHSTISNYDMWQFTIWYKIGMVVCLRRLPGEKIVFLYTYTISRILRAVKECLDFVSVSSCARYTRRDFEERVFLPNTSRYSHDLETGRRDRRNPVGCSHFSCMRIGPPSEVILPNIVGLNSNLTKGVTKVGAGGGTVPSWCRYNY